VINKTVLLLCLLFLSGCAGKHQPYESHQWDYCQVEESVDMKNVDLFVEID